MTPDETRRLVEHIDAISAEDPEEAHASLDGLLLDRMPEPVVAAAVRLMRRCEWWATA